MNFTLLNRKQIGNIFIIISILSFVWLYAPFFELLLPSNTNQSFEIHSNEDAIFIPKINAYAKLLFNINPWDESQYEKALATGVAHAAGTPLPGEGQTSYLFAHSSLPIWKMTRTNTPFLLLGNLTQGDKIIIMRNNKKYSYEVIGKTEVWPNEVQYLKAKTEGVDLILQTCTPLGTALKRLLVFSRLVV